MIIQAKATQSIIEAKEKEALAVLLSRYRVHDAIFVTLVLHFVTSFVFRVSFWENSSILRGVSSKTSKPRKRHTK
jgi:hypothetical protein